MSAQLKIGTHSGTFHCDEALAIALLKFLPKYQNAEIIRTRDKTLYDTCDIVVDVGGVYFHTEDFHRDDPEFKEYFEADEDGNQKLPPQHRYDHHQRGFEQTLDKILTRVSCSNKAKLGKHSKIKLSSAGLIYSHYGIDIIAELTGLDKDDEESFANIELLFFKMYESFVEGIDAVDNGVSQFPTDVEPLYRIGSNLSTRVSHLNPWWNQKNDDQTRDELFKKAVELTGSEFRGRLEYYHKAWLSAKNIVRAALDESARMDVHESGRIVKLESFCPWKEHLYSIEEEMQLSDDQKILYVLFGDSAGSWRVQCVSARPGSFENRKSLPKAWRGLRNKELDAVTGVAEGAVFVHAGGFIGGHKTYEGALAMAQFAVSASEDS